MGLTVFENTSGNYIRPLCTMTIKQDLLGNKSNTNFKNDGTTTHKFYLNEYPSVSISYSPEASNSAIVGQFFSGLTNTSIAGINITELASNLGSGFVPMMNTGTLTLQVIKEACYLDVDLKTRIFHNKTYNNLFHDLLKITLPADGNNTNVENIMSAVTNLKGAPGGALEAIGKASDFPLNDVYEGGKAFVNIGSKAISRFTSNEGDTATNYEADGMSKDVGTVKKAGEAIGKLVDNVINTVNNYIAKEFVSITISGMSIFDNIPFLVQEFNVTQSPELVENTLDPLYMDFDIKLQSLGKIDNTWKMETTSKK